MNTVGWDRVVARLDLRGDCRDGGRVDRRPIDEKLAVGSDERVRRRGRRLVVERLVWQQRRSRDRLIQCRDRGH